MNTGHKYDEKELKEFEEWFESTLGMTMEKFYDDYLNELEEYKIDPTAKPHLPIKKTDPGSVIILCQIEEAEVRALCDVGSSVNVMPLSLVEKFKLITPTAGTKREVDHTYRLNTKSLP
ncbi:hypothetical protein QL285_069798 [Trifolium repens]|nr:hypothetical protein QL285_069798 [Trifolium repens]